MPTPPLAPAGPSRPRYKKLKRWVLAAVLEAFGPDARVLDLLANRRGLQGDVLPALVQERVRLEQALDNPERAGTLNE